MRLFLPSLAGLLSCSLMSAAQGAELIHMDVVVSGLDGSTSSPTFNFKASSSNGAYITTLALSGHFRWFVANPRPVAAQPGLALSPSRLALQARTACAPALAYGTSGPDASGAIGITMSGKPGGCGTPVIDLRPVLNSGSFGVAAVFSDGRILSGHDWQISPPSTDEATGMENPLTFRQSLSSTTAPSVPEPASWTLMMLGFGMIGASMRQRRYAASPLELAPAL